jgi:hypothetical protein
VSLLQEGKGARPEGGGMVGVGGGGAMTGEVQAWWLHGKGTGMRGSGKNDGEEVVAVTDKCSTICMSKTDKTVRLNFFTKIFTCLILIHGIFHLRFFPSYLAPAGSFVNRCRSTPRWWIHRGVTSPRDEYTGDSRLPIDKYTEDVSTPRWRIHRGVDCEYK